MPVCSFNFIRLHSIKKTQLRISEFWLSSNTLFQKNVILQSANQLYYTLFCSNVLFWKKALQLYVRWSLFKRAPLNKLWGFGIIFIRLVQHIFLWSAKNWAVWAEVVLFINAIHYGWKLSICHQYINRDKLFYYCASNISL